MSFIKQFIFALSLLLLVPTAPGFAEEAQTRIVIVGARTSQGQGVHEFFSGVRALETMLMESAVFEEGSEPDIEAFPFGWTEETSLDGATTLVMYFDGRQENPLQDAAVRSAVGRFVSDGGSLVAVHHATFTDDDALRPSLKSWFGGTLPPDGELSKAFFSVSTAENDHPAGRGVGEIAYVDEAYSPLDFDHESGHVRPVVTGQIMPLSGAGNAAASEPRQGVAAWAFERVDGGRSFAFTGGNELSAFDVLGVRTLLLNAIAWASRIEIPETGVSTQADPVLAAKLLNPRYGEKPFSVSRVMTAEEYSVMHLDWGRIDWHVTGPMGNTDVLTTGIATVDVGKSNPRHYHPNCDEVLHVVEGHILHTMNDVTVEMKAGDTVSIPKGVYHNATNIGDTKAVLAISFDSAWREVIGE